MSDHLEPNDSPQEGLKDSLVELGEFELPDPVQVVIPKQRPVAATLLWEPKPRRSGTADSAPDVEIFVTQEILQQVQAYLKSGGAHEHAGFLLGNRFRCPNTGREYVLIDNQVEAKYTETTPVSVTFTVKTWAAVKDELDNKHRGKMAAGWYHSHPDLSVFLSPDDTGLHRRWFEQPFMSALVIDPVRHEGGFFALRGGVLSPDSPVSFYELLSRDELDSRRTSVGWRNYRCSDPRTGKIFFPPLLDTAPDPRPASSAEMEQIPDHRGSNGRLYAGIAVALVGLVVTGIALRHSFSTSTSPPIVTVLPTPSPKLPQVPRTVIPAMWETFVNPPEVLSKRHPKSFWFKLTLNGDSLEKGDLKVMDWQQRPLAVTPGKQENEFYIEIPIASLKDLDAQSEARITLTASDKSGTIIATSKLAERDLAAHVRTREAVLQPGRDNAGRTTKGVTPPAVAATRQTGAGSAPPNAPPELPAAVVPPPPPVNQTPQTSAAANPPFGAVPGRPRGPSSDNTQPAPATAGVQNSASSSSRTPSNTVTGGTVTPTTKLESSSAEPNADTRPVHAPTNPTLPPRPKENPEATVKRLRGAFESRCNDQNQAFQNCVTDPEETELREALGKLFSALVDPHDGNARDIKKGANEVLRKLDNYVKTTKPEKRKGPYRDFRNALRNLTDKLHGS